MKSLLNKFSGLHKLVIIFLFVSSIIVITELTGIRGALTPQYVQHIFESNIALASVTYILIFTLANFLNVPGWIFLATSMYMIGRVNGAILTYFAAVTSCTFSYYVIGLLGGDAIRELRFEWARKMLAEVDKHPIRNIVILRTIFQTLPPLNYALALSGIKPRHYFIATIIGLPIPIAIYASIGGKFIMEYLK